MEVVRIKKILARNLLIFIGLHCVRRSSWTVTTLATLLCNFLRKKWGHANGHQCFVALDLDFSQVSANFTAFAKVCRLLYILYCLLLLLLIASCWWEIPFHHNTQAEILTSNSVGAKLFFLGCNQDNNHGSNFIIKKKICLVLPEKEISNHRN